VNGSSAGGAGVGAGPAAAAAAAAVAAFLRRTAPPEPFSVATLGAYRALCLPAPDGATRLVALLAGEDGAVYAATGEDPGAIPPALPDLLKGQRLRPTGTTLALRIPTAVSGAPPRPGRFTLWASPAYLAAGGGSSAVWK
jgi:hypothetical protein